MLDRQYEQVLEVPDTALYGDSEVFVVEDGRLASRTVKLHAHHGNNVLVTSAGEPGIANGDLIVVTQLREAGAGTKVDLR